MIASRQGSAVSNSFLSVPSPVICSFHSLHLKWPVAFSSLHGKYFWSYSVLHPIFFPFTPKLRISWHLHYSYPELATYEYSLHFSTSRSLHLLSPLPDIPFPDPSLSGYLLLILQALALKLPPQIKPLPTDVSDLCLL